MNDHFRPFAVTPKRALLPYSGSGHLLDREKYEGKVDRIVQGLLV